MTEQFNIWPKKISVDKRIVRILSESTYENFPVSLKEIITNSYDADSSEVFITIDINKEIITIEDNGKGMSEEEFDFFLRIAGIKREKEKNTTNSGRFIVGKFGVGFLSIFPYFKYFRIESTKKGSDRILISEIPCYQYFSLGQLLEVSEIPIQGEIKFDRTHQQFSYTKISLSGFTTLSKSFFFPKGEIEHRKYSILNFPNIEKLKYRLEEDLPIEFEDNRFNILTKNYSPNLPFKVYLNGLQLLRRNFAKQIVEINGNELSFQRVYGNEELEVNETNIKQFGKIKFQYFILTDKKSIHPYEARVLKRRNLNVGVGDRTAYGLGTEIKGARSRLHWLTGEVLIIDGLNELINVQRSDFYYDPDYLKLSEFIIERLSHHSNQLEMEASYIRETSEAKISNLKYLEAENEQITVTQKHQEEIDFKTAIPELTNTEIEDLSYVIQPYKDKIAKTLEFNNKKYSVRTSKWNFQTSFYPAVKIEHDKILINMGYPLFSGVKFTDVFIKLHLLLILNLEDGSIDKLIYKKLTDEILEFYKDYI